MFITLLKKCSDTFLKINSKCAIALLVFSVFFGINNANAQVNTYVVDQLQYGVATTPAAFTLLPSPAVATVSATNKTNLSVVTNNEDDAIYPLTLPFSFSFGGVSYPAGSTIRVSTNGFVTFGTTLPTAGNYNPISSTEGYSAAISVFGRDMDVTAASTNLCISYFNPTLPVGSRILKVEWIVKRSNGVQPSTGATIASNDTNPMIFQLWLYETSNVVEMHYNSVFNPSQNINLPGQIGLRGASNTDFTNLNYATVANWPGIAPSPLGTMPLGTLNTNSVATRNTTAQILGTSNRVFRFTPVTCFAPTGLNVTPTSITSTTATINWNAASPNPLNGYEYYVTTSATAPTAITSPTGSVAFGITTASLTGLTANALHYVYVRSKCSGSDTSSWSPVVNFSTYCTPVNTPYYRGFSGPAIPSYVPLNSPWYAPTLPTCTSQENVGTGNPWVIANGMYPPYGDSGMDQMLMYNNAFPSNGSPGNVWFFTEGINLDATKTYVIDYIYGGTVTPPTAVNKMMVAYGTSPLASSMTTVLDNHPNIKASGIQNYVVFTPSTTGVYYFGLKAYSDPGNGRLYVDDLQVYELDCKKPTNVSVSNITGTTAQLSWNPPTPAPTGGYVYYVSTSNTAPVNGTTPTGSTSSNNVVLTGLTGSTNYYFWVRSNCGSPYFGEWAALVNGVNSYFTTLVQFNYCASTSTTNQNYFTNVTSTNGITNVANATAFSVNGYGDFTNQIITQSIGGTVGLNTTYNSMTGGVGVAVWVDWNQDGNFTDATERMYNSAAYLTAPPVINFTVPGTALLGITRMRVVVDWNATSPLACGIKNRGETEDYAFQVVTPPPALTIDNTDDTVCASSPSNGIVITAGLSDYNTFSWSPSTGVTGAGTVGNPYIITSNTSQVYTLTATQTVAPFRFNTVKFTYNANPLPTPIIITPASPVTVCPSGPAALLTANGGIVSGVAVLSENFNGATNSFTTLNSSTGGAVANAAWTLRPSGYNPGGSSGITSVVSNDASQFYLSNSDAQGSGSQTDVILTSPVFSLAGYTSASLSFYHYYKAWINGSGTVEISTNGTAWTTLQTWGTSGPPNETQGTPTAFSNPIYNLNSYVGQTTLQVRFKYSASWGFVWAIDNFLVSGSTVTSITWSPTAGLFTNAAATIPYTGAASSTVYAAPTSTTIYTASASSPSPVCTTSTNITVNVAAINGGTASSNQNICNGSPANLTLTGYSGTISGWQYSATLAFTSPVSIASSASAILTSTQMGTLTANRYYRAVITNGLCTAYSNVVSILLASTNWDGSSWSNGLPNNSMQAIFDDVYDPASDTSLTGTVLNACSILVTGNGTVTVNPNYTFHVENAVVVDFGGTLTFQNNSSLVQVTNVANSGDIVYIRNSGPMRIYDYTYWSSPVAPQTLVNLSPLTLSDKYLIFNPIINNWQNVAANSLMDKGRGYAVRSPQNFTSTPTVYTAFFSGVPNNGNISLPFTIGAGDVVLIGNPYPSALNADLFMLANSPTISGGNPAGNLDPNMYFWTHNTPITANNYIASDYAIYNYAGGVGTAPSLGPINSSIPTGKVAAGQGFFMKALSSGAANFTNAMRINGQNNQFYKNTTNQNNSGTLEKHRVWLEMFNNQGAYKQTMVGYIENATNGLDLGFDAELFDGGNSISLYSTLENKDLGIQSRALPFVETDIVPLGYKSNTAGTFEIKLSNFDGLFEEQHVYLEDYLLNTIHDLKGSNYSFATNAGTFENRFALRFTGTALSLIDATFNDESVIVVKNNQTIGIQSSNTILDSVTVFDIRGRELFTKKGINANEFTITNLSVAQQVLILKIKSVDGKVVDKKIVF